MGLILNIETLLWPNWIVQSSDLSPIDLLLMLTYSVTFCPQNWGTTYKKHNNLYTVQSHVYVNTLKLKKLSQSLVTDKLSVSEPTQQKMTLS